jgi:hypothetical protein
MQNNPETLLKHKLKKINSSFILLDLGKLKVKKIFLIIMKIYRLKDTIR